MMTSTRGSSNGNVSGSSYARRERKRWLVAYYGYGGWVRCWISGPACVRWLTVKTVWADRIVPGCRGGTYRRSNLRPACQSRQGGIRRV